MAHLQDQEIDLVARPTREACRSLNELAGKRRLAAGLASDLLKAV